MTFGIYVHIPYCLQICPYCDFTKYEFGTIMPPANYNELLAREIRDRAADVPFRELDTLYFGGGTPSLFEAPLILSTFKELEKAGFRLKSGAEFSIEIDPATVDPARLDSYLEIGVNRFSVGAQTFNERLLKIAGRKHSSHDTIELLQLLKRRGVNYSFDLLFALPTQSLEELRLDLVTALQFHPSHLSAYLLTVPENHPMDRGRAPEEEQAEMFAMIGEVLNAAGLRRYELSNFARPGFESRHNTLYWTDQPYWGLGTGAHSYFPKGASVEFAMHAPWGVRFWNAPSLAQYEKQIAQIGASTEANVFRFLENLPGAQLERLGAHQALTDFCHTSLRLTRGLIANAVRLKFGDRVEALIRRNCSVLCEEGLLTSTETGWALNERGRILADRVFSRLTFLEGEVFC